MILCVQLNFDTDEEYIINEFLPQLSNYAYLQINLF